MIVVSWFGVCIALMVPKGLMYSASVKIAIALQSA